MELQELKQKWTMLNDRLSKSEVYNKQVLMESWEELPPMFVTSSENKQGRDEVLAYIEHINQELKNG